MNNVDYDDDWGIKKKSLSNKQTSSANDQPISLHEDYEKDWGIFKPALLDKTTGSLNKLKQLTEHSAIDRPREAIVSDVQKLAGNVIGNIAEGVPSLLSQLISEPGRAAKNLGTGIAGIPINIANSILNLPAYIAHLESNKVSDVIKKYTPQIPKEKFQNYIGGEPNQEDINVRNLTELAPITIPLGKAGAGAAIGLAKKSASKVIGKGDPILEANKIQLELRGKDKAAELDKATEVLQQSEAEQKVAQAQSQQELGKSNPDLMTYNITKKQQDIENLSNQANKLKGQLSQVKPYETALPQAEANLAQANEAHQNAQNMIQDIDTNIGRHLNEGAAHDVRAAAGIDARINSIENYWNDSYKKFHNDIKDAKFQMPQEAMNKLDYSKMSDTDIGKIVTTYGADAFEALRKNKLDEYLKKQGGKEKSAEPNPYFDKLMEVAPTVKDINAADFLAKYKDFRDRTFKLSRKLRDPRVEEVEHQKIQAALDKARPMQAQMKEVLDAGLGEYKPEFERLNKGYSEQVYPLRENPIVEKAEQGDLSSNLVHDLRTNEPGMPLMREIVKQDPEILRNVIGQRYFSKSGEIDKPNEMTLEYLQHMPELQKMLEHRQQAGAAVEQTKANAQLAKEQHANVQKSQGESDKLQSQIDDLNGQIAKHQADILKHQEHIFRLQETAKSKNINLQKKISIEKELKALRKELADTQKKLSEATTGLRKVWMIAKTLYRVGRKIS